MSAGTSAQSTAHKNTVLAIILVSYVTIVLDISVVLTGLPRIHAEFGLSEVDLARAQAACTPTFGGTGSLPHSHSRTVRTDRGAIALAAGPAATARSALD